MGYSANRAATLALAESGVASSRAGAAVGDHPACTSVESVGLSARRGARKVGDTAAPGPSGRPLERARAEP